MYPLDSKQCLKQLKTFNPPKVAKDDQSLPTLLQTPTKAMECEVQLGIWEAKLGEKFSSPSRPKWESFVKRTKKVLCQSQLQESELRIH